MPKINSSPMSRPATPGTTIPANHSQKINTGQSPGRPATKHQVPSCGVIQIEHKPTGKKLICSTADVKKTLKNVFKGCHSETLSNSHPKLVSCFNGGSGQTKEVPVCPQPKQWDPRFPMFEPNTGSFKIQGGVPKGARGPHGCFAPGTKYGEPDYINAINQNGGNIPNTPGPNIITMPLPSKTNPKPWGPCGPGALQLQDVSIELVRKIDGSGSPYLVKAEKPKGWTLPAGDDSWMGPARPPKSAGIKSGTTRGGSGGLVEFVGPTPRPTTKHSWDVNWLGRWDKGTVSVQDLAKYEIAFKEAIQPELNGDRRATATTHALPNGGGNVTTRYNFCGTNGTNKGNVSETGGFCGTGVRTSGGMGGKKISINGRGNHVKNLGPVVGGKQTYTTVPNSAGQCLPQGPSAPRDCCNAGGNSYDFEKKQNPANFKLEVANMPKPFTKGPYAQTRGNGRKGHSQVRLLEKSLTQNCEIDRAICWPSLPRLGTDGGLASASGVGARRVGTRPIPPNTPTARPPNWVPQKVLSPKPGGSNTSFKEGSRVEGRPGISRPVNRLGRR